MVRASSRGKNKSLEIRNYKQSHPTATPSEIAEALQSFGLEVKPQFVSTVLFNARRKGGVVGKPGRKPSRPVSMRSNVQQLMHAKQLVDKLGSIEAARSAINALAHLLA